MNYASEKASGHLGGISPARPPSLEQRLDYLQRGLERVQKIRSQLGNIAERLAVDPRPTDGSRASPPPSTDLSGRFGDLIGYLHANLDDLEQLANRLDGSLFDSQPAAQAERAR